MVTPQTYITQAIQRQIPRMYFSNTKLPSNDVFQNLAGRLFSINERQEPLSDCLHQSLAQFLVLLSFSPPLIDHQPSHIQTSQSFTQFCPEFCCFHQILSVRNHSLLQHLRLAVSEVEHDHLLDLGEVKLCWRVLIHLTISALLISGSFSNIRREWHFKLRHSQLI